MSARVVWAMALVGGASLFGETVPTRHLVTVREVKITYSPDNETPGVKEDVLYLRFEATLRNRSDRTIFVSAESATSAIPEILLLSGEWQPMLSSRDQFWTTTPRYPGCKLVQPGKTFTFPEITDFIVLGKNRPANEAVRIRVNFKTGCATGSATLATQFVTEAIQIQ